MVFKYDKKEKLIVGKARISCQDIRALPTISRKPSFKFTFIIKLARVFFQSTRANLYESSLRLA